MTFLRPGTFMRNFVNYLGRIIKTQNAFYLPAVDGKVSFVDARDIAAVSVQVLTSDNRRIGKAYTITGKKQSLMDRQLKSFLRKLVKEYPIQTY